MSVRMGRFMTCLRSLGLALLALALAPSASAQPLSATEQVARAEALIGASAFAGPARYAHATVTGHVWLLEQSGDLEGGWLRLALRGEADVDLIEGRADVTQTVTMPAMDNAPWSNWRVRLSPSSASMLAPNANDEWRSAPRQIERAAARYRDLFPALLLRGAREASDITRTAPNAVAFTRAGDRVTLRFGAAGALEGFDLETSFPEDMMLSSWGRTVIRGEYGFWWRDASGAVQPRQLTLTHNGRPWMLLELSSFTLSAEAPASFGAPFNEAATPPARAIDDFPFSTRHEQIAPGVRVYYGAWNIVVVEQRDGLVVLDAPISPGYSRALLQQIEQDFPGKRVRAVVTTSTAWPHAGGIAEYARRGIRIYGTTQSEPLVNALTQAAGVRRVDFRAVENGDTLGHGANALTFRLAPGPELDGMLFAQVGDTGLIWASDALQLENETRLAPHARQYAAELLQAVCAHARPDARFVAMHTNVVPLQSVAAQFVNEANRPCPSR